MKKMLAVAGAAVFAGLVTLAQTATNVAPTALKVVETTPEAAQTGAVAKTVEATSDWLVSFTNFVEMVDGWVWGVPLIAAILVTGLLLTCILRFTHLFNLKTAFGTDKNSHIHSAFKARKSFFSGFHSLTKLIGNKFYIHILSIIYCFLKTHYFVYTGNYSTTTLFCGTFAY